MQDEILWDFTERYVSDERSIGFYQWHVDCEKFVCLYARIGGR